MDNRERHIRLKLAEIDIRDKEWADLLKTVISTETKANPDKTEEEIKQEFIDLLEKLILLDATEKSLDGE